jgi:hypothetical protein
MKRVPHALVLLMPASHTLSLSSLPFLETHHQEIIFFFLKTHQSDPHHHPLVLFFRRTGGQRHTERDHVFGKTPEAPTPSSTSTFFLEKHQPDTP